MEFRRNSHSGERRRRVLIEETGLPLTDSSPASRSVSSGPQRSAAEPVRSYTDGTLSQHQRRVIDLIPRRPWTVLLLTLLALTVAVGLEALYGYLALGYTTLHIAQVPAVDLTTPGNLADWFSSSLLLAAAGWGILTYLIRRHRVDDYRGRYRMWYWVVPLLVVASIDQVCDLQHSLRTVALVVAGIPDYADAAWIWSAVVSVVTLAVVVRLGIEMRASRLAVASLCAALACVLTRQAAALDWVLETRGVLRDMALAALMLCGSIHLFLALCLYARHVYRDACGEIVRRARQARPRVRVRRARSSDATEAAKPASPSPKAAAKETPKEKELAVSESKVRVDAPHSATATAAASADKQAPVRTTADVTRQTPASRGPLAAVGRQATAEEGSDEDEDDASGSTLSKAERRRQRKLQRREKRHS